MTYNVFGGTLNIAQLNSQNWTDVEMSPRNYWDACMHRGYSGVTQRPTRASR